MKQQVTRLTEGDAIQQIARTVRTAGPGTAPFALVLGAGFSHGLVPTAREIVEVSLPLWTKSLSDDATFEELLQKSPDERRAIVKTFWKEFSNLNNTRGLTLELNDETGLPRDNAEAYRAAFNPEYDGALGAPALARKFQRTMMALDKPRLNAAHFLLGSVLGVQPSGTQRNNRYKMRAAFCRLILTTNFDPFLQICLQAVNRLYFMSDTPELGVGDELLDDQPEAIHLVYLHGSVHRRSQAATESDIQRLKETNARTLAPVLKRHGVIVIGYSGWDDAVVEALAACDRFDHRLYWCGRESDPMKPGVFGPRVGEILRKSTANYVQIDNAGRFMAKLSQELVEGLPRLFQNPIAQIREMLQSIDLKEFESILVHATSSGPSPQLPSAPEALAAEQKSILKRLLAAEQLFVNGPSAKSAESLTEITNSEVGSKASDLMSSARAAMALADYVLCLDLFSQAISLGDLLPAEVGEALLGRALAFYFSGEQGRAIQDWSSLIELPGAPVEQVAEALNDRGITWGQQGDWEKAIADHTRVIEQFPGAPVEQVAQALYNRGVTWGQQGDWEKAIADYTRVIEQLPGAPVKQVAQALYNRGVMWGQQGDSEKEIADYTRVIEQLPGAPVKQVAQALYNRGVMWGQQGDSEKEIADYTRVIEQLPDAPVEQVAQALNNRGVRWGQQGDSEKAIADYTRVIEHLPGAPVEQVAKALNNRGVMWGQRGDSEKAIADYTRVIEQLPGAPVEQVAQALYNRGVTWGQQGDSEKAIADYTSGIEQLPDAPVKQVAKALNNRGVMWGQRGDSEKAIADQTRVIDQLPGAPVEQVAQALYNRGVTWGQQGDSEKAIADYTSVIEQLPGAPVEQVARALYLRGLTCGQQGDWEKEIADYTRVIEQLPGAPVKEVARALYLRGLTWGQQGDSEKAIADYTRLIEQLTGAPVDQVARALYLRGLTWGQQGDSEKAIADYTRLIEQLPGAPVEQVAKALANRAWRRYENDSFSLFLQDTEAALDKASDLDYAAFNLGLAFLACGRDEDALKAYKRAAARFPGSVGRLALPDLAEAENKWLSKQRASAAREVLRSLSGGDANEVQASQSGEMVSFNADEPGSRASATTPGR